MVNLKQLSGLYKSYLRPFVYQDQDREEMLPTLEFAYNDTKQSTIRETPFYLNYGFHPTGTMRHETVSNPHTEDHIQYLIWLQEAAKDAIAIADAQQVQQRHANRHRSEVIVIKEGDWVLLRRK
jgi:hypothetical protein